MLFVFLRLPGSYPSLAFSIDVVNKPWRRPTVCREICLPFFFSFFFPGAFSMPADCLGVSQASAGWTMEGFFGIFSVSGRKRQTVCVGEWWVITPSLLICLHWKVTVIQFVDPSQSFYWNRKLVRFVSSLLYSLSNESTLYFSSTVQQISSWSANWHLAWNMIIWRKTKMDGYLIWLCAAPSTALWIDAMYWLSLHYKIMG